MNLAVIGRRRSHHLHHCDHHGNWVRAGTHSKSPFGPTARGTWRRTRISTTKQTGDGRDDDDDEELIGASWNDDACSTGRRLGYGE